METTDNALITNVSVMKVGTENHAIQNFVIHVVMIMGSAKMELVSALPAGTENIALLKDVRAGKFFQPCPFV